MPQYCKYCANMVCGDANYCNVKQECYTDEQLSRANKCKHFELNRINALTGRTYKPRVKNEKLPQIGIGETL